MLLKLSKHFNVFYFLICNSIFLSFFSVERYVLNLSKATPREILRREVCHRLALGRVTRSSLIKHLAVKDHVSVPFFEWGFVSVVIYCVYYYAWNRKLDSLHSHSRIENQSWVRLISFLSCDSYSTKFTT